MAHKVKDNQYFLKAELNKLSNSWELIPGADFDELNDHILRILQHEHDDDKLQRVLESELIQKYGLFRNEFDLDQIIRDIKQWWSMK